MQLLDTYKIAMDVVSDKALFAEAYYRNSQTKPTCKIWVGGVFNLTQMFSYFILISYFKRY